MPPMYVNLAGSYESLAYSYGLKASVPESAVPTT